MVDSCGNISINYTKKVHFWPNQSKALYKICVAFFGPIILRPTLFISFSMNIIQFIPFVLDWEQQLKQEIDSSSVTKQIAVLMYDRSFNGQNNVY